jgi:hypothetical protein
MVVGWRLWTRSSRSRICVGRGVAAEGAEPQRIVAAGTSTQPAAYRAENIRRVAECQTDSTIGREMGLAIRTVVVWRHRFADQRLARHRGRPKCPPPPQYHTDIQARLLVLACQPAGLRATLQRSGKPHVVWSGSCRIASDEGIQCN